MGQRYIFYLDQGSIVSEFTLWKVIYVSLNQNCIGLEEIIYREDEWIKYLYRALYVYRMNFHKEVRFICAIDFLYSLDVRDKVNSFFSEKALFPLDSMRFYECSPAGYSPYVFLMQEDSAQGYLTREMCLNQPNYLFNHVLPHSGWTILMVALRYQKMLSIDFVSYFLEKAKDLQIQNAQGCDILMFACRYQRVEVIESILSKVDHVNHQNNTGRTALMSYIFSDHFNLYSIILNRFIAKGLNPNLRDSEGSSLLTLLIAYRSDFEAFLWIRILCEVLASEIALDILSDALRYAQAHKKEQIGVYLKSVLNKRI